MGHVELICGSMFSGKTEELIRRVKRVQIARQKVQVFKPAIDARRGTVQEIGSHDGAHVDAVAVRDARSILPAMEAGTDVVAIDEAQFLDAKIVGVCKTLADHGKRVILAGLDLDFRGEPFGPMPDLMARAEIVDKLRAICVVCGNEASRSQRLVNGQPAHYDDSVIMVGAEEVYEARCRECHEVGGDRR